jgi:hypothetical protein
VTAVGIGDDTAALAACQGLASLLVTIHDPFLHAAAQLAMAWTSPVKGDFDRALQQATAALQELRDQDEPVFTSRVHRRVPGHGTGPLRRRHALPAGGIRPGRADRRQLAGRCPGVQLGILAVLRGSLDEARGPLEEALRLSLAVRNTAFVTMCLSAYAWLALADGDPERAARLQGAAEGLRRRIGLRAWPILRPVEADLVGRVRERLGEERFHQAFTAGSRLSQRQAVGIVRDQPRTEAP